MPSLSRPKPPRSTTATSSLAARCGSQIVTKPTSSLFAFFLFLTRSPAHPVQVFANLDFSKGYKGITCFLVEREHGLEVAKKEQKLGIRASSTCTVNFDEVKIPLENLVGEEGKGYKYAIEILNEGKCFARCKISQLKSSRPYWYCCADVGYCQRSFREGCAVRVREVCFVMLLQFRISQRAQEAIRSSCRRFPSYGSSIRGCQFGSSYHRQKR